MTVVVALHDAQPATRGARRVGGADCGDVAGATRRVGGGDRPGVADVTRWLHASDRPHEPRGVGGLERVATGPTRGAAAERLRAPYLDAIGELSRRNASPRWWATHLAAKHPYPSLFTRLCALAVADELLDDGMLVVCSTPALAAEVAALATARELPVERIVPPAWRRHAGAAAFVAAWTAGRTFGRLAPRPARRAVGRAHPTARFALDRTPGHRRRTLRDLGAQRDPFAGPDTALVATWVDERSFDPDGGYRDPHFGPLAERLEQAGLRVALLPRVLPGADFAACAQRLIASGQRVVFPDAWLDEADWRRCERAAARYRPAIRDDLAAGGVPLARLAREYLEEHRRACADALSYHVLVRRLAEAGVRPHRVVLPWEGHAWEHALTEAVHHRLPGSVVVGYDNLNFSRLALSLYPAASELDIRPLPDRVVTNGPAFARVLAAEGFPADRIRTGCALRHDGFARTPRGDGGSGDAVLAAGSIDVAQTVELVRAAQAAFGDRAVVKLHPACDAAAVRAACPGARYDDRSLGDQLPEAVLLLYTYSSVAYDALAARVPPVFVRSETFLDLDQLEPFPGLGWSARGPDELRAVGARIDALDAGERIDWERRAAQAVDDALAPCGADAVTPFL